MSHVNDMQTPNLVEKISFWCQKMRNVLKRMHFFYRDFHLKFVGDKHFFVKNYFKIDIENDLQDPDLIFIMKISDFFSLFFSDSILKIALLMVIRF